MNCFVLCIGIGKLGLSEDKMTDGDVVWYFDVRRCKISYVERDVADGVYQRLHIAIVIND